MYTRVPVSHSYSCVIAADLGHQLRAQERSKSKVVSPVHFLLLLRVFSTRHMKEGVKVEMDNTVGNQERENSRKARKKGGRHTNHRQSGNRQQWSRVYR